MNFVDIFKTSFLQEAATAGFSNKTMLITIVVTALVSAYVFVAYRMVNRKAFYNKSFNVSLFALGVITAAIIMTIQSNIVISLGMVGALSIVRFRTAVKDPMDLVFLFWSISVGIMCGANCFILAMITSAIVTLGILIVEWLPIAKAPQILVVNSTSCASEKKIMEVVTKYCTLHKVKARNLTKELLDMAIEVRVKEEAELVNELIEIENVTYASLVSHDGEVTF